MIVEEADNYPEGLQNESDDGIQTEPQLDEVGMKGREEVEDMRYSMMIGILSPTTGGGGI